MATKIFPSTNDVNGGVAGDGKTMKESNLVVVAAMPYHDRPYVKSGAAGSNAGGLDLSVASGHYMIGGYWVFKDAAETVPLAASATNRVWLQLVKDASGNVTGTTWVVRTDTTVLSDAVITHQVVTGASTITTINDSYRGVIAPGKIIGHARRLSGANDLVSASAYTNILSFSGFSDGVTHIELGVDSIFDNVNSGLPRAVTVDLRWNGVSVGESWPRTYDVLLNSGANNRLSVAGSARVIPAMGPGTMLFAAIASANSSVAVRESVFVAKRGI